MGVDVCGCPISSNVVHKIMSLLKLIKRAAHSDSEADAMTFLILREMARIAPLLSLGSKF